MPLVNQGELYHKLENEDCFLLPIQNILLYLYIIWNERNPLSLDLEFDKI